MKNTKSIEIWSQNGAVSPEQLAKDAVLSCLRENKDIYFFSTLYFFDMKELIVVIGNHTIIIGNDEMVYVSEEGSSISKGVFNLNALVKAVIKENAHILES